MATIALYAGKINQMSSMIGEVKRSVADYESELFSLKAKTLNVNKSVCNLDDIISSIQSSTLIQEEKITSLEAFSQSSENFIAEVVRIDENVAYVINQSKDDFYAQYSYLKPEYEMEFWEDVCDGFQKAGEWCKEHWEEIVVTVVIVVGAAISVAAVILTGGAALVPLLSGLFASVGVSAGTAMTVATIMSFTVGTIAVVSTVASSTLNIIDTWGDIDNPTFNAWQTALNWTSMISNGFYSVGSIYSGIKGISNSSLREYSKSWLTNSNFRSAIIGADKFSFTLKTNTSTFWSGISDEGMYNGDLIASNCAEKMGRTTLESTLTSNDIDMPTWNVSDLSSINAWNSASSSYAMNSLGSVNAFLSQSVRSTSVWNVFERILLNINPRVTGITTFTPIVVNIYPRIIQLDSILMGIFSGTSQFVPLLKDSD